MMPNAKAEKNFEIFFRYAVPSRNSPLKAFYTLCMVDCGLLKPILVCVLSLQIIGEYTNRIIVFQRSPPRFW